MSGEMIVVAMSGGVDSSLAAALLHEEGYRVVGVTMKLWDYDQVGSNVRRENACCPIESTNDARAVCERLGVPHYTLDLRQAFEKSVIEDFVSEYEAGRTPNPCVRCNSAIKWKVLLKRARLLGANLIATGHYAQLLTRPDGTAELRKGLDPQKDQSYALWGIPQETLRMTRLPLGRLSKDETRRMATDRGLKTAHKPESQEVCFIPDNDYGRFLAEWTEKRNRRSPALVPGNILNREGRVVGTHRGVAHYTIGQRKGLGVALGRPQFVTRIDAATRTIWIGDPADLEADTLTAAEANWTLGTPPEPEARLTAKIRYLHAGSPAHATLEPGKTFTVRFDEPQRAITPGQSVVLYDGDLVIGGGVITSAFSSSGRPSPTDRDRLGKK